MTITKEQVDQWILDTNYVSGLRNHTQEIARLAFEAGRKSAVSEPVSWRTQATAWLRRKANEQQEINEKYPRHVECYPSWETKVRDLNWLADDLEREQESAPYGLDIPPAAAVSEPVDKGPWTAGLSKERVFIESDKFEHDVRLYVDGDFESIDQRYLYACGIARQLNATPPAEAKREPLITREQHIALREAFAIGAADSYFEAYPTHDNDVGRMLFERGFARGFDSHERAIETATASST